jgi:hypothetical protein
MSSPKNEALIKRTLGERYVKLEIESLRIEDDMRGFCQVKVQLSNGLAVVGKGVGQIDAIFDALKTYYRKEYESLHSIELLDLKVALDRKTKRNQGGTDMECLVSVEVKNSRGKMFWFSNTSRSLASSSAKAVAAAVEFFINSEQAFFTLQEAIKDAEKRDRQDLKTRFLRDLSRLAENTSYAMAIKKKK